MKTNQPLLHCYPISEGGPFYHALVKMHLDESSGKLVLLFLCITWLPLVIITGIDGTLFPGVRLSFVEDVATQVRLLVGIPMLLLLKSSIDGKVIAVEKYVSETLMKGQQQQVVLEKFLRTSRRLSNSALAEIMLLLILISVTVVFGKGGMFNALQSGPESWKIAVTEGVRGLSLAGKWADHISTPLFQFLLLRWLWKYAVWSLFLFRLSTTQLTLQATHPDKAGGLSFFLHAQRYWCLVFVVISIVISGELMAILVRDPGSFSRIRGDGTAYILICLFFVLLPQFFFFRKLIKTRETGLLKLSKLGASLSGRFEEEWIDERPVEQKTTNADVSTSDLQDYDTIYASLEQLLPVPFTLKDVLAMTFLLFLPYLPILFIHFSIVELLQKFVGMLV